MEGYTGQQFGVLEGQELAVHPPSHCREVRKVAAGPEDTGQVHGLDHTARLVGVALYGFQRVGNPESRWQLLLGLISCILMIS